MNNDNRIEQLHQEQIRELLQKQLDTKMELLNIQRDINELTSTVISGKITFDVHVRVPNDIVMDKEKTKKFIKDKIKDTGIEDLDTGTGIVMFMVDHDEIDKMGQR